MQHWKKCNGRDRKSTACTCWNNKKRAHYTLARLQRILMPTNFNTFDVWCWLRFIVFSLSFSLIFVFNFYLLDARVLWELFFSPNRNWNFDYWRKCSRKLYHQLNTETKRKRLPNFLLSLSPDHENNECSSHRIGKLAEEDVSELDKMESKRGVAGERERVSGLICKNMFERNTEKLEFGFS